MTKEEAQKLINDKLAEAHKIITKCEKLSDEHQVGFYFQVAYGMGGSYAPRITKTIDPNLLSAAQKLSDVELQALGITRRDIQDKIEAVEEWEQSDAGWRASSQSC